MLIGVDFDNTIVCYDDLFHRVAVEQGLIPPTLAVSKEQVRNYLRQRGQEDAWTEMQGYVYGARMREALPFPGAREFFVRCARRGVPVRIISHKTRYPYLGPRYDLHQSAVDWLTAQGFFDPAQIGLSPDYVYFDLTKQEKLARIAQAGCTHFIDDLPEILVEPGFPAGVKRILFNPTAARPAGEYFQCAASWPEIETLIFGEEAAHEH